MAESLRVGDCVRIPDGRIGRVRDVTGTQYRVRVRRTTSATHQFLMFAPEDLQPVDCPKGWMSPEGYVRYLTATLAKMQERRDATGKPCARAGTRHPSRSRERHDRPGSHNEL
jgi:hypothetical protein